MKKPSEYSEQCAVFEWAELMQSKYPQLKLLNANIAGVKLSIGSWVKLKKQGYKKGCFDITLQAPSNGYHSLNIEMKKNGGKVSPEQKEWKEHLEKWGNLAKICYSADEAIKTIEKYLSAEEL